MKSKRTRNLLFLLAAIIAVTVITVIFTLFYLDYGSYSEKNSLFYLLSTIDYLYLVKTFSSVMLIMFVLDSLIIAIRYFWQEFDNKESAPIQISMPSKATISNNWKEHRMIHLTFILLTIAIAAPVKLMNTFTAIVSISVLISNLTRNKKTTE